MTIHLKHQLRKSILVSWSKREHTADLVLGGLLAINCFSDASLESEIRDSMTSDTKMKNAEENQRLKYLRFFAFL